MEHPNRPSALLRYGGLLLFASLSLAALAWFGWSIIQIITQIRSNTAVILFDKGAVYMLGVGMGLLVLTYGILHEVILGLALTKRVTKRINISALISIIVLFIVPHLVHYLVEHALNERDYIICDQASYQWLLYRRIVYVSNFEDCANIIEGKK